ncbi:SMP-30/gluconolactonase/LRE family protein [Acinetobacter baumannii]|uniref:SMP-30/gluconolactonase/LRE family protein n=1 Tax=Acinetobacter baumannii TaxID=470 RepID=UPI000B6B0DDA|nr:SMP-30/gluconolactonase/LRE family protein [Acinetobacter baumannii]MDT1779836.1 SMP-30/gluconolactonase/LRE family protein [Acinetobacter baumannii]OWX09166.1 hypothetical protein A7A33_17740 [Acinetobacter baumannii]
MEIKVLVDVKTKLGECPTWDAVRQRLFWVDIVDGRLFCCDEFGGNIRAWEVHKKIGSFALQENYNGAIVALEDGLYQLDFDTGNLKFISLYTTNFTEPLSYQDSAFLKLPKFP